MKDTIPGTTQGLFPTRRGDCKRILRHTACATFLKREASNAAAKHPLTNANKWTANGGPILFRGGKPAPYSTQSSHHRWWPKDYSACFEYFFK
ncbi:MAG: hypothetical protein WCN92_09730 [Eubacteriales bacterium]